MAMAICPACEGQINLQGKVEMGQSVVCPHCSEDLEVIDIEPLELDWAFDEEDWDEDEDGDEDEISF
jgi:lysine biosynthesis protein LysW